MTPAEMTAEYQRANLLLARLACVLDVDTDHLPSGTGAFHRPEGLGVFIPLDALDRVLTRAEA